VHRDDVAVTIGESAVLPDLQKVVWSAAADGVTVQVTTNSSWRSHLLDKDAKQGRATPTDVGSAPRPTPPLAPQANVVGSFGTSPRVGQTAALGAFVLPTSKTTVVSPAAHAAKPAVIPEELPPLIPVTSTLDAASPTSAGPRSNRSLPFGIGASTFDLEEDCSPSSGGGTFPDPEEIQRRAVTAFLQTVSEFHARPNGVPMAVSVGEAANAVINS
jgi:hypothetical protein